MLAAAALLSLTGAVYASVDNTFPAAPALDVGAVHGATAFDRAALRSSRPAYGVSAPDTGIVGPILSLDPMDDHPDARRVGPWYIYEPPATDRSLPPRIDLAEVRVEGKSSRRCKRSGKRHKCGEAGWQYVGPTRVRVQGREQACIWTHPIANSTIVIHQKSVLGGPFEVEFALADRAVGNAAPVDVLVKYGAQEYQHEHPDRRGFTKLSLPEVNEPTALEMRISAENVGRRHFCYRIHSR